LDDLTPLYTVFKELSDSSDSMEDDQDDFQRTNQSSRSTHLTAAKALVSRPTASPQKILKLIQLANKKGLDPQLTSKLRVKPVFAY